MYSQIEEPAANKLPGWGENTRNFGDEQIQGIKEAHSGDFIKENLEADKVASKEAAFKKENEMQILPSQNEAEEETQHQRSVCLVRILIVLSILSEMNN